MLGKSRPIVGKVKKLKIRKGDNVIVIAGGDKGKEGEVLSVYPGKREVIVHQAKIAKKATKANPQKNDMGGIVEIPAAMNVSNVMLVCPRCGKPSRVTYAKNSSGKTSRKCGKCGELIDA